MDKQLIVAIDREFGSGGKEIAGYLSEYYGGIPVYEKNMLKSLGIPHSEDVEMLYERDETPRWLINSRTVRGLTNSNEEVLAAMEFEFLKDLAEQGESFIVLGHCAEEVLKDYPGLITFFVSAGTDFKIPRIMEEHHLSHEEAVRMMKRHNRKRKSYHNYYCNHSWGDSRYYDLCLRSDKLGAPKTAEFLEHYIDERLKERKS